MEKILSICIPTWNRKKEITHALEMIAGEAKGIENEIEVCISNNGSTDGTKEYLDEVKGSFKFSLTVSHNEKNIGFDANVLKVFEMGTGKWLWLFGDDEEINKNKLSVLVDALKKMEPEVCVVYPNEQRFSQDGSKPSPPVETRESIAKKDTGPRPLIFSPQCFVTRVIIRREAFSKIGHDEIKDYVGNVEMHMWIQRYIGIKFPSCRSSYLEEVIVLNTVRDKYTKLSEQLIYARNTNRTYRTFFWQNKLNLSYYLKYYPFFFKIFTTTFFPGLHLFCEHIFREGKEEKLPLSYFTDVYGLFGAVWYIDMRFIRMLPSSVLRSSFRFVIGDERYSIWKKYWNQDEKEVLKRSWV